MFFEKIAPYLQDPLVLMGFVLMLFFGLARVVVKSGLIPVLTRNSGYLILSRLLLFGFILAALIIALGFGLKYREISRSEQQSLLKSLKVELADNLKTVDELRKNIESINGNTKLIAKILRNPKNKITFILFPPENIDPDIEVPASLDFSRQQFKYLTEQNLLNDDLERAKFNATALVVSKTIERTKTAMDSLSDTGEKRYRISDEIWNANLPILRKINLFEVDKFQSTYHEMRSLRQNYNVTVNYAASYRDTLLNFFNGNSGPISEQNLASLLAAERIYITTSTAFHQSALKNMASIEGIILKI